MAYLPTYYDQNEDVSPEERRRRANCSAKATFATAELARAAAVQAEWTTGELASELSAYQCRFCNRWHLSRNRQI